ncbi:hypothetical protein O181_028553 [Austropuccinia psidii MF-1]|uniref:Uncharacterized protein n=1 Tax=Austropuccinia psidii MF-1 TaxID=1389203 RepID=A0A9Q3CRS6_9BASI|nr:hypothetical protein [Austropuccinia psidii MF-1]
MSVCTHVRKATKAKPFSNEEVSSLLNLLKSEVLSLRSARTSDASKMQSLQMTLSSPPPPITSFQHTLHLNSSAYNRFMQEPYCTADCFNQLWSDGSNLTEWVLCVAFNSKLSVDDSPSLLNGRSPQENRDIPHFVDMSIPHDFALCVGVIPSQTTAKDFFEAIKVQCFQKLKVV